MIPVLDRRHYLRLVGRPASPGWNPTTHLAELHFPDAGPTRAWVKIDPDFHAFLGNEAIGWTLARALEIQAPDRAALIIEDAGWFREILGDRYPNEAGFPASGDVAAWCCADVGAAPIKSVAPFDEWNLIAFLRSEDGARIAAFDHWLGNQDRNNGNLLRLPAGRYAVIDHGILFCYQDWRRGPVAPDCESFLLAAARRLVAQRKLTLKELRRLQAGMAEFSLSHQRVAAECHPAIMDIITALAGSSAAENVLSCVSERSRSGRTARSIGLLA